METSAPDDFLSPGAPMLVGLAIDVSASMTKAIHNPSGPRMNRLEAFRNSLKNLAERGRDLSRKGTTGETASPIRLFAYGFGFGNPLSVILGRSGPAVRDLLNLPGRAVSLVSIDDLADNWAEYEAHLESLAIDMFGSTPMREALEAVQARFDGELRRHSYHETAVLFLLSDGMPNPRTVPSVLKLADDFKHKGRLIVSCYVTDGDLTEPRRLYNQAETSWPEGARLMFDCASEVPEDPAFTDYLYEYDWTVDDAGRLFAQVNRSDVLTEFLNAVISPVGPAGLGAEGAKPVEVFISYAHEDEDLRERLEKHLSLLRRQGFISTWHDRKIKPGREWQREIDSHIESAGLILLLISEDFISSDYCYGVELSRALERHREGAATVIPVVLKPVDWEGAPFEGLQMLPTDAKPITKWRSRAEALTDVARGIRKIVKELSERG